MWNWRDRTDHTSFSDARAAFHMADQAVSQRIAALDRYAAVEAQLRGQKLKTFIGSAKAASRQAQKTAAEAQAELGRLAAEIDRKRCSTALLQ